MKAGGAVSGSIEIEGLEELRKKLERLDKKTAKAAVRKGLRAGAKVIWADAKDLCPVITGTLRASLKVRAFKGRDRSAFGASVQTAEGWFKGDTFYGAFVEFGTSHAPPHPYLRPAFDTRKEEAAKRCCEEIAIEIERDALAGA